MGNNEIAKMNDGEVRTARQQAFDIALEVMKLTAVDHPDRLNEKVIKQNFMGWYETFLAILMSKNEVVQKKPHKTAYL